MQGQTCCEPVQLTPCIRPCQEGYATILGVKYFFQTALVLTGLALFILLCMRFAPGVDAAKREMVVAAGGEEIFVLDGVSGTIFELKENQSGEGLFRALSFHPDKHTEFLPVADIDGNGYIKFYGEDSSGPFELSITQTESGFFWGKEGVDLKKGNTLIKADGASTVIVTAAGITISRSNGNIDIAPPQGDFAAPVAARHPAGDWIVVWPAKTGLVKYKKGALGAEITGYGNPGNFTAQVISPAGAVSEYKLEDESFVESRATSLTDAVVDSSGRLILLDNKGYLATFNGTELVADVFAQVNPSRYATNTIALGPEDTVLVTDAVSNMVSMIDPGSGKVLCSWRLPRMRIEETSQDWRYLNIIFDLLLLLIVIIFIVRIRSRIRRYRQYRPEGEK